ncbi:MFS transporter [Nakamurella flavida]|uniref:MFS transporter n=1 Tax=Nakamurella flavida TaxID=363630 RepID=A0A938YE83_9ACTN|nr:MFS transporter [Nakamurella flavida]
MRVRASVSSLFWGLQFALLNPALALLLVSVYGATGGQVGGILAAYNTSAFLASVVVPAWADRRSDYLRPMLGAAGLGLALAVVLVSTRSLTVAVVALVVLGGPAGVGVSLLFAHLQHAGARPSDVVDIRAVFSVAFVAGPPLATVLMGAFGDRALLVAVVAVAILVVVASAVQTAGRTARASPPADRTAPPVAVERADPADPPAATASRTAVVLIVVAFVALQASNTAEVAVMGLFVTERLGLPVLWAGTALGVAAALEIPALLAVGRLAGRVRILTLVVTGCVAGLGYGIGMTVVDGTVGLIALQILNAWFVAVVNGAGLALFLQVIPRPGLASGMFSNTFRLGSVASGPILGWASTTSLGYSAVFAVSAALTVPALVLVLLVGRRSGPPRTRTVRLAGG